MKMMTTKVNNSSEIDDTRYDWLIDSGQRDNHNVIAYFCRVKNRLLYKDLAAHVCTYIRWLQAND